MVDESELDFCSECSQFVDSINELTGWCDPCSGITPPIRCQRCNRENDNPGHKYCFACRYIRWLEHHADEIEIIMATDRISAAKARRLVHTKGLNQPHCLCCGNRIKGGQINQHFFCTKTKECRKAHHAYRYHRRTLNRSHDLAVHHALIAAAIVRITTAA